MPAREEWQMQCADCGDGENLEVEVQIFARLHEAGTEIDGGDHVWDENSACYCHTCGWSGRVLATKLAYAKATS